MFPSVPDLISFMSAEESSCLGVASLRPGLGLVPSLVARDVHSPQGSGPGHASTLWLGGEVSPVHTSQMKVPRGRGFQIKYRAPS